MAEQDGNVAKDGAAKAAGGKGSRRRAAPRRKAALPTRGRRIATAVAALLFPPAAKPTQPPPPPRPADIAVGAAVGLALSFLVWAASLLFGWRIALPGGLVLTYALGWASVHPAGRLAEGFAIGGHARSRTALCIVATLGLPLALAGGHGLLRVAPPVTPASSVRAPAGVPMPPPLPTEKRGAARNAA